MPIHIMQSLWLLKSICADLDKLSRGLMWGKNDNTHGLHLVNWATVSKPKKLGGLRIRDNKQLNIALLGKWCGLFSMT